MNRGFRGDRWRDVLAWRRAALLATALLTFISPLAGAQPAGPTAATREARPMVTIYEFRSGVSEVGARAATDMFVTALVRTGLFRVVERNRLNEGVVREKQLNANGLASGDTGTTQLHGARYIFEGTISEANAGQEQRSSGVNIGGMEVGGGSNRDVIGIDVRVVDAASGEVLDVVTVHRAIDAHSSNVSGVGSLLGSVMAASGRALPIVPDVHTQQQTRQSVDGAVRSAIEEAVATLGARFGR